MFGTVTDEIEVEVSASEAWKVYGTLQLADIVLKELPDVVQKIDLLEGDGGVGTVLELTFPPGLRDVSYQKEKFTVVDDEKRVKVAEVIESGYLDMGFDMWKVRFEVIPKDENSCITRVTVEYEVKDVAAANLSLATTQVFLAIMNAAAVYLTANNNNN